MKVARDYSVLVLAGIGYGLVGAVGFENQTVGMAFMFFAGVCCGLAFAAMEAKK